MFRALKWRALFGFAAVATTWAALAGSNVAAASAAGIPYWGTAITPTSLGEALFTTANCPSAGTCVVGGEGLSGSGTSPVVAAESGGTWGPASDAAIAGVSSPDATYASLSCVSASLCEGVGYNDTTSYVPVAGPILLSGSTATAVTQSQVTLPSSPTGASTEEAGLVSVSCVASGACTAVGFYETNASKEEPFVATSTGGGSWTTAIVAPPAAATGGANLTAVSCPNTGACEAVGNYGNGSGDIESWSVAIGSGAPQTIALPSDAVPASGSLPSDPTPISIGNDEAMQGISCPSSGVCTAIGTYYTGTAVKTMAVSISNGAPAAGVGLPSGGAGAYTVLTGIWCSDASNCTADGDVITVTPSTVINPVTQYEASGSWSPVANMPGTAPSGTVESLVLGFGCSSIDTCIASGTQINTGSGAVLPLVDFSAPPLSLTTTSLPAATAGASYSTTLQATGGAGTPTWSITGALPPGLTLDSATGVISGKAVTPGTYSFTAQLTSAGPPAQSASVSLTITVAAVPKLSAVISKVTSTSVTLTLGCSGSGTCKGKAMVVAVEHLSGKTVTAVTAKAKKTKTVTLATGSYSVNAGKLGKITLKLNGTAKRLLSRFHKISTKLTLTPTGAKKPAITKTVTFKSATKKK